MDPLSVTTAVVGLLSVIPPIVRTIKGFIHDVKDAPQQAQIMLQESTDIENILSQLQSFLLHRSPAINERSAHISVEQVILTLTGTVLSFSELQELLDGLTAPVEQGFLNQVKWVRKEKEIGKIVQRLQNHKASLGCMLHIMNTQSLVDVNDSVSSLERLMQDILAANVDLARRMESLEQLQSLGRVTTTPTISKSDVGRRGSRSSISSISREMFKFAFDHDLQSSRVYRKTSFRRSHMSLPSLEAPSGSWSLLSGLSISQVSNVSVLALPLTASELSNAEKFMPPPEKIVATMKHRFTAERADEMDGYPGETLIITALSSDEWIVAKPIGRLGGPGLVPISFIEIRGANTGYVFQDSLAAIKAAGIPTVTEWKEEAAKYVRATISLGKIKNQNG
ncbi:hypothetical protein B0J14DRAFT_570400 [Halenospora varia]|nr:hypothetical protein B0J14DRAFT_570400 [Halenospora varia]